MSCVLLFERGLDSTGCVVDFSLVHSLAHTQTHTNTQETAARESENEMNARYEAIRVEFERSRNDMTEQLAAIRASLEVQSAVGAVEVQSNTRCNTVVTG